MQGTALRWLAVIVLGIGLLAVVLYLASTVDGRAPAVTEFRLTQSLSTDTDVALRTTSIEVVFSEAVDHAGAQAAFGIEPDVNGAFSWSGSTMIFTPDQPLPLETDFTASVATGVRDEAGNRMTEPPPPFAFSTVGPPSVVGVDPPDGATDVPLEAPIRITFSTLMDTTTAESAVSLRPAVPLQFAWRQEVLEVTPLEPLLPDRRYELTVDSDATDQAGTPLAERSVTSFTTVASGLRIEHVVPADESEGIAVGTSIALELDGEVDPASLRDDMFVITPEVAGSLDIVPLDGAAGMEQGETRLLRFVPSGALPPNTTFSVTVSAGLRSIDGRVLARDVTWSFTTGAPQPTLANQVLFLSDRSGVTNLWAMNADGTNERQLSSELSPVTTFAAAPDGRSFVVGDGARLIAARADGGDRRVLTDAGALEFDPAFSPDGSALVFGRADAATGAGLGIWRRDGLTGSAQRVDLAPEETASAPPSPSEEPAPLLRAPRYAPDGSAIAWIDESGAVVILDIERDVRSRAPFMAAEPPVWLPDGDALVLSGVSAVGPVAARPVPNAPVPPLEEGAAGRQLVRLDVGADEVEPLPFGDDAGRVAVGTSGRVAFVRLSVAGRAGTLWLSDRGLRDARQLVEGDDRVARAAFAPDPDTLVIERTAADGSPAGLWLLDVSSGRLTELSEDGSQPRPLP